MADSQNRRNAEQETERDSSDVAAPPAMSVAEAGRKGGRTTARRRGPEFYREIGRKGGVATSEAHGPTFYSEIGRKGGEARADDPDVRSGELGRKGALARWGNANGDSIEPVREESADVAVVADARAARKPKPRSKSTS